MIGLDRISISHFTAGTKAPYTAEHRGFPAFRHLRLVNLFRVQAPELPLPSEAEKCYT